MKYPGSINKTYTRVVNYKNRGMDLESIINDSCKYYLDNDIAIIYKKPTPIGVVDVDYKNGATINKAYFKEPSTLDYNGIYKGKYVEFDAKECRNTTSFPLNNIHSHQIKHIERIITHGGICFLIISMNSNYYLFKGEDLLEFIKNETRKSLPFSLIDSKGYKLIYNYNGLKFIEGIDALYKELIN
ncbi:MAG: Holliday junction resolvase RecU [Ruminococcus sp.]|nr:Holliday junction resolvase RecU [Ruminococcus sp.]